MILSCAILSGCGGSSSSSSGTSTSTAAKVAITSSNQSTISNSAINQATQNLVGSNLSYVGGVQTTTTPTDERFMNKWTDFAFQKLTESKSTPLSVSGAVISTTQCTTSGNIQIDTDGSNTTTPTYLTIIFNNCVESGTTGNGTISLSNLTVTPNTSAPTSISATFAFNFTVSNSSTSAGIYGGFTIAATGIGSASRQDSFSGTSFNVKYGSQYETLTNFAFVSTYNNTGVSHGYSDTVNYSFASDVILAGFDFATINPLVRNYLDVKPRSGQVIITGANSGATTTKLRVTVVSANPNAGTMSGTVTLELSQNNGATYGSPVTKTWTQLAAGN